MVQTCSAIPPRYAKLRRREPRPTKGTTQTIKQRLQRDQGNRREHLDQHLSAASLPGKRIGESGAGGGEPPRAIAEIPDLTDSTGSIGNGGGVRDHQPVPRQTYHQFAIPGDCPIRLIGREVRRSEMADHDQREHNCRDKKQQQVSNNKRALRFAGPFLLSP